MRVLFDTNVILDLLLDREPFAEPAAELLAYVETGDMTGYVCATTITTVHYLATKVVGLRLAKKQIERLLRIFEVAPVNRAVLEAAHGSRIKDYEDAVLSESARQVDAQAIVTRNLRDFRYCSIPVYTPDEMLKTLDAGE